MDRDQHTPMTIQTALACLVCPENPASKVGFDWYSEPAKRARSWRRTYELLEEDESVLTDRGKAWTLAICMTPLPVAKWVIPANEETPIQY